MNFAIGYIKTQEFRQELQKLEDTVWEKIYDKKGRLDYMEGLPYRVHAIISNLSQDWSSREVVEWYNERCGG